MFLIGGVFINTGLPPSELSATQQQTDLKNNNTGLQANIVAENANSSAPFCISDYTSLYTPDTPKTDLNQANQELSQSIENSSDSDVNIRNELAQLTKDAEYPKNSLPLVIFNNLPDDLIYFTQNGKTPAIKDLIYQYTLKAKIAEEIKDPILQITSTIKIANLKILQGAPDAAIETLKKAELLLPENAKDTCELYKKQFYAQKDFVQRKQIVQLEDKIQLESLRKTCLLTASYYQGMGNYFMAVSNPVESASNYQTAITLLDSIVNEPALAQIVKIQLSSLQGIQGSPESSYNNFYSAIPVFKGKQYQMYLAMTQLNLANMQVQNGNIGNIEIQWGKFLDVKVDPNKNNFIGALYSYGVAEYLRLSKRPTMAIEKYQKALKVFSELGYALGIAFAKVGIAQSYISIGDPQKNASNLLQDAQDLFKSSKNTFGEAIVLFARAQLSKIQNQKEKENNYYTNAIAILKNNNFDSIANKIEMYQKNN